MSEDYFDFVEINGNTIILFGRRADGNSFHRELTDDERERVYALTWKHDRQRETLLRELAA
jgi:hypothetical protein